MHVLGIDLAKLSLAATLLSPSAEQHHISVANTPEGFAQLQAWLIEHQVSRLHVCMEATNTYWEAIASWLHAQGYTVSVVNPSRIKGFGQALLQRTKTDRQDSLLIALFCSKHQPPAWKPSSPEQQHLRALVRLREDLIQSRVQHQNRLADATDAVVKAVLQQLVALVNAEIEGVEERIKTHIATQTAMQTNLVLLSSVIGIGVVTASKLLAEMANLEQYSSAKAAAADVGVTPSQYESGTSVYRRPRMSKLGKADIRAALYYPALTAMRWCPAIRAFAERLAARGKPKKVIIGAVMRKLVHICYGVLKHQTPYDPAKVSPQTIPST